jgi:flagellum-specific peptidoglycan hydrolase FlgJ
VTSPATPKAKAAPARPAGATPKAPAPASAQGGQSRGGGTPLTPAQQAFIAAVAPGAVAAQRLYGVPASVTIAQAIDESGWGQSSLAAGSHNLFGIKGSGPAGSVTLPTQEFEGGQWITINAQFAAYRNDAESIAGHAALLATSGYYGKAMADRADPDAFANDLTGVYATDPNYGATLITLMKTYNLYQYDTAPPASTTVTPAPKLPGSAAVPGVASPALSRFTAARTSAAASTPGSGPVSPRPARALTTAYLSPARAEAMRPARNTAAGSAAPASAGAALAVGTAGAGLAVRRRAARYAGPLPQDTLTALTATAAGPLSQGEHLYRDVAARTGGSWELLAAVDWMQCKADPRTSPVHGEKLGTRNGDGTCYPTRTAALAHCARDLTDLAAAVYGIDLTQPALSVRQLAAAFAAFRWGALLHRHQVSPMEFPYSVAGLTAAHHKMRWPQIAEPAAPDRPGSRFHGPFGAVPIVLSLGYHATAE